MDSSSPASSPLETLKQFVEVGDSEAVGKFLDRYRFLLLQIAAEELDPRLRQKAGDSDLVQLTLIEAGQAIHRFEGESTEALAAWLRKILVHNIANLRRAYLTDKRNIYREVTIAHDDSTALSFDEIAEAAVQSGVMEKQERKRLLEAAFVSLPAEYQLVIRLRTEQELSFQDVGLAMDRSADAARKLWARAVESLSVEIDRRTHQ